MMLTKSFGFASLKTFETKEQGLPITDLCEKLYQVKFGLRALFGSEQKMQ